MSALSQGWIIPTRPAVGGALAMLLVAGAAQAQSPGWNLVHPQYCYEYDSSSNGQIVSTLIVYTQTYTFQVADDVMKGAILQWCYNNSAFYGYNAGPNVWSMFWIVPGLR
jgi:hypothetical protein